MPLLLLYLAVPLLILLVLLLIPVGIVRRYRAGTARQTARGWQTLLTIGGLATSLLMLAVSAGLLAFIDHEVPVYTASGVLLGLALGGLGLLLTRWESGPDRLRFTPNRWLVLAVVGIVVARIAYGLWRAATLLGRGADGSLAQEVGVAGSMAAAGLLLGYYLAYWVGVRIRWRRHRAGP